MKKTILAATLLAVTTSLVQAQELTLYGTADAGVGFKYLKNKDTGYRATKKGLITGVWNSNSWGLKGKEKIKPLNCCNFRRR